MAKHLELEPLNVNNFIKVNELEEVNDPMFFARTNLPTSKGLLSNEIFGVSKEDRTTIFAYIHLADNTFMHPLAYKIWNKLDSNVKLCAYEMDTFSLDKETGKLKSDPNGETGLKYLKKLIKTIDFKKTASSKRNIRIDFLTKYRDSLFIDNFVVIPAGYRDVDTDVAGKNIGVGVINKIYNSIIRDCKALRESDDYGLSLNGSLRGRIQDSLVKVYDFIVFGRDPQTGIESQASGLSRKIGLIRRAGMRRSFDWGSRLVICTQDLRKEKLEDLEIDLDHIGLPLAALCANFYPYMLFHIRQWFANNLSDEAEILAWDPKAKTTRRVHIRDWRDQYSDERIKEEIDRFMHGVSNRFMAIEAPIVEEEEFKGKKSYLMFKGFNVPDEKVAETLVKNGGIPEEGVNLPISERPLTWCDLIFMAAKEIAKDKSTLITRFPIDTYWNQYPAKIKVLSTIKTVPMVVNNTFYPDYPNIEASMVNKNTSNIFMDVALPNNVRLDSIGGDFDGDTVSSKVLYSIEANDEMFNTINSKKYFIGLDGQNLMYTSKECIQSLYNLTLVLPDDKDKLTNPEF